MNEKEFEEVIFRLVNHYADKGYTEEEIENKILSILAQCIISYDMAKIINKELDINLNPKGVADTSILLRLRSEGD